MDNPQSAAKNLSIKLLETESSNQVLKIFEEDYIKSGMKDVYPQELCLLLHFTVKHMGDVTNDIRMTTLLDMLFVRYEFLLMFRFENLEFEISAATIWSLGVLVAYRGAEFPTENKHKIIKSLKGAVVSPQSISTIPSLIFSISCMLQPQEVDDEILSVMRELSQLYIDDGLMLIEPLPVSSLLMGWSRVQYHNENFLHQLSEAMQRPRFFFATQTQDVCNIIYSLADLHFSDDKLMASLHEVIMERSEELQPINLFLVIQAYARLVPKSRNFYLDLVPKLIEVIEKEPENLTAMFYEKQWLCLAVFKGNSSDQYTNRVAKELMKLMNRQDKFSYSDLSGTDASNILIAITSLKISKVKFVSNIVSVAEHHLKSMSNFDLINMVKSSHYLRSMPEFQSCYTRVHSE